MAVFLSPVGGAAAQFFTNNGIILSGGKLYAYAAGTTTPQATFTSSSGNTNHTNPIILDSAGRVATGEIWLTGGVSYKFLLKDSNDVLIATYDNVSGISDNADLLAYEAAIAASSGSSLVGFIQSGTGAVATTVQAKLRQTVSVKDFGAVGDGTTDDTAAIQAALNAAYQVFLPTGTFRITSTITISSAGSLIGEGFGSIIVNNAVTRGVFTAGNNVIIANLRVVGTGSTTGHVDGRGAIHCENATNVIIDNVKVVDARSTGISIGSCTNVQISNFIVDNTLEHGLYLADSDRVNVTNGNIYNAGQLEPATVPQGTGFKIAACTDIAANNVQTFLSYAYGCIVEGYITKSADRINFNNVSAQGGAIGYSGLRITNYVNGLNILGGFYRGEYGITNFSSDGIGIPQNIYFSDVRAQGGTSFGLRVYYGSNVNVFGGQYISGTTNTIFIDATAGTVNIFSNAVVTNGGTNTFGYSIDSSGNLIPIKSTQTIGDTTYPVDSIVSNKLAISDSITAPSTLTGYAQIYVDSTDGDLKVKFGDGTVKTIVTD